MRAEVVEGFRWLIRQRLLRTMAFLIGLLNVTLTAALAVLVLLARDRLHLGSVGYGLLFTCMAVGGVLGSVVGDRIIGWITATWTIRVGLLIEAGLHLALAASRSAYLVGFALFAFGVHGALWGIVGSSLRQRLTPPEMLGRVGSTMLFIAAGGNCVGALLGGAIAARFGHDRAVLGGVRGRDRRIGGDLAGLRPGHGGRGVRRAGRPARALSGQCRRPRGRFRRAGAATCAGQCAGWRRVGGRAVAGSPVAASSWAWVRKRLPVSVAPPSRRRAGRRRSGRPAAGRRRAGRRRSAAPRAGWRPAGRRRADPRREVGAPAVDARCRTRPGPARWPATAGR